MFTGKTMSDRIYRATGRKGAMNCGENVLCFSQEPEDHRGNVSINVVLKAFEFWRALPGLNTNIFGTYTFHGVSFFSSGQYSMGTCVF